MTKHPSLLSKLGYRRVSDDVDRLLFEATRKAFEIFGDSAESLVRILARDNRLSEKEFLLNCDVIQRSLDSKLGKGIGKIIMNRIKCELFRYVPSANSNLDIKDVLDMIRLREIVSFIRTREGHEHMLFLYNNKNVKETVLSEFFGTTSSTGGILLVSPRHMPFAETMLYEQLLSEDRSKAMNRAFEWVYAIHAKNNSVKGTRIAGEDASWFFRNGLASEFMETEKLIGTTVAENISFLCSYDITEIDDSYLEAIIPCHGFVILDEPLSIYTNRA